jgi:hypothetical protein
MEIIIQGIPLCALLLCDALYILDDRLTKHKWIFSVIAVALHVLVIIYFLLAEASMETALLFLMASLAAVVTVHAPKSEKYNT